MSFKDLDIRSSYVSKKEDIIVDFYEPVLSQTKGYDRLAGFFTSSSLAIAARGIAGFIKNQGHMRLLCSPILSKEDAKILHRIAENDPTLSFGDFGIDFDDIVDDLYKNHVKALGWMILQGLLEIRLAVVFGEQGQIYDREEVEASGIFHMKVGIMTDTEGNQLSFNGSINETANAWTENCEQFKVFKEWEHKDFFEDDLNIFNELWNGEVKNVKIYKLPEAIKQKLIIFSKDFDLDTISKEKYLKFRREKEGISLFPYQRQAVDKWISCNNIMLFEMATGTGKTRTAIAAIEYLKKKETKLIVIISCPQNTLSVQWRNEILKLGLKFDENHIIDGTNPKWKNDLSNSLSAHNVGYANQCVFFTTHDTSSSETFLQIFNKRLNSNSNVLFVGDEVHWLGAKELRKALQDRYQYRIGLSATPSRWFDDLGTKLLLGYFNNNIFEFTIKDALTTINPLTGKPFLVDYLYKLKSSRLNEEEAEKYRSLTLKMAKLYSKREEDFEANLLFEGYARERAKIIQNAEAKYEVLKNILKELKQNGPIRDLLVFVSPGQKEPVKKLLREAGIVAHQLTQKEGTKAEAKYGGISERESLIIQFKDQTLHALVAIKCLDEGIDIPSAHIGILMSSSTNPREYVQRIGRIIRQDTGKTKAILYDIYVSEVEGLDEEAFLVEQSLRKKEKQRLSEIAENAFNYCEAISIINSL